MAYFTALAPVELLKSPAVALVSEKNRIQTRIQIKSSKTWLHNSFVFLQTFINKTLGHGAGIVISFAVAIACIGTINSSMLGDTR